MLQYARELHDFFLSSLYKGRVELRERIHTLGKGRIWVAEKSMKQLGVQAPYRDPLVVVDNLVDALAHSKAIIVVLGPSRGKSDHGSLIQVEERFSNVSYFEIELYQAASLQKPIEIFAAEDFDPGPRLRAVLKIFRESFPQAKWHRVNSDDEIEKGVQELLHDGVQQPLLALSNLIHVLHKARPDDLLFLDDRYEKFPKLPQKDLIEELLSPSNVNSAGQYIDTEKKLARVWIALRELMGAPYKERKNYEFLPLWNKAFGRWIGEASWYGLHGHIYLGCLAAINSLHLVRQNLGNSPLRRKLPFEETQTPWGQRASALFSIAKLLPRKEQKETLKSALYSINNAIKQDQNEDSNLKAVRGSVHLLLRHPLRAIRDYRDVLKLRERKEAGSARIGDAMTELGFAYVCVHRYKIGTQLMQEGLALLSKSQDKHFLIRGKKKMSMAYNMMGLSDDAAREQREALDLAENERSLDQIRQIFQPFELHLLK